MNINPNQYIPERTSHWSFDVSAQRLNAARNLRRIRTQERARDLALGASLAGKILGEDSVQVLRKTYVSVSQTRTKHSVASWL